MTGELTGWSTAEIARRVMLDIPEGWYVNLGIGMPTAIAAALPPDREVVLHSENGIVGVGPPRADRQDPDVIDAGKAPASLVPGGAFISHSDSFALIRGGHLDLSVMGAYEVSRRGDLANWSLGDDAIPAVGGAMDLAVGARRVWVMMRLLDRTGSPRLVAECRYPLTARAVVSRIYSDLAVLTLRPGSDAVELVDAHPAWDLERLAELLGTPLRSREDT